jgi:hypothetical protein
MPQEMNCSNWDCFYPSDAINKTGVHSSNYIHINDFIQNSPETQKLCSEADIIMIERNLFQDALTMMMFWKVRGASIGIIFDDGYHCIERTNPAHAFWAHGEVSSPDEKGTIHRDYIKPPPIQQLTWGVQMSKGLQTVSQALCDYWSEFNDTYLIHNHLVMDKYKDIDPLYPHSSKDILIGWTGSQSHRYSFKASGILRAYRKILNKYPNVKILIGGDKTTFDELDVPNNKKLFCNYVPAEQYSALVKSFDLYTIPLAGKYDLCRSQIKPLECSALKVPWVATDFPNYNHLLPYGHFTENGKENWEIAISNAIDNLQQRREFAEEVSYPFALTQDIDLHVQERIDLYQKLIDKPYKY